MSSRIFAIAPAVIAFFCIFITPVSALEIENPRIDVIYLEETATEENIITETETETSNYNLATGGEINEDLRCANDGDPSKHWLLGQRIPSFIPNIKSVSVRSRAASNAIAYALRAVVSTSAIATSTDASVICLSEKSSSYSLTAYTSLLMEFSPACELETNTNYYLYIQTEDCADFGAGYNVPKITRKYDAWGGRRYYDFFRGTQMINDYDLHAVISFASSTYEAQTITNSEYTAPIIVFAVILIFIWILVYILKFFIKNK